MVVVVVVKILLLEWICGSGVFTIRFSKGRGTSNTDPHPLNPVKNFLRVRMSVNSYTHVQEEMGEKNGEQAGGIENKLGTTGQSNLSRR
jgi:hypothetical protein